MKALIFKNYLTTIFGSLAGLPALVLSVFTPGTPMALPAQYTHILMMVGGIGVIGFGLVSKDFNVHSTAIQVEAATIKADTAQVVASQKAADAQVAAKP